MLPASRRSLRTRTQPETPSGDTEKIGIRDVKLARSLRPQLALRTDLKPSFPNRASRTHPGSASRIDQGKGGSKERSSRRVLGGVQKPRSDRGVGASPVRSAPSSVESEPEPSVADPARAAPRRPASTSIQPTPLEAVQFSPAVTST